MLYTIILDNMMALASMIRAQVQLTEKQMRSLKTLSEHEKTSVSELVRRAIDAWVGSDGRISPDERRRRAIDAAGSFASGRHDIASNHDEYLADAYRG